MIQHSGFSETTWILRFLLLISVTLISACENEEITKPQPQLEPAESPLPVREWYPAPKHRQQQPMVYVPVPTIPQQSVMGLPAHQWNAVQQPWSVPAQQPVYSAPQPVYQVQPSVTQYQQPQVWTGQQPVFTLPQPVVPQYQYQYQPQYQYVPRPWGNVTEPNSTQNPAVSTDAWPANTWPQGSYPQGSYLSPWSVPATGSSYGVIPGQAGQMPGTTNYGAVW